MKKIGYIDKKNDYLDNYIEELNLSDQSLPLEDRINILFSDTKITERVSRLKSSIDIFRFYRRVIREYIPNEDKITLFGGYSEKNIKNGKKYTILTNLEENGVDKFWIWSNKKRQMQNVSKVYMKQFLDNGLVKIVPGKNTIDKCRMLLERLNNEQSNEIHPNSYIDESWSR